MERLPIIYRERCDGCGLCVEACACKSLVVANGVVAVIEHAECGWCLVCEVVCPTDAIAFPFEIVVEEEHKK